MEETAANPVTGVLLAGGLSRRMGGGDKCLRDLAGRPMLARVIERLAPQVGAMVLNANGDPARFQPFGLAVVPDTVGGFAGPLAGVLAGMRWSASAAPDAQWIVTVSTDAPFLPLDLTRRLLAAVADGPRTIALAASGGDVHPVIGLWPVVLADDLEQRLEAGVRKVLDWTGRHASVVVDFPFLRFHGRMIDPFFNANTPEELDEARALIESSLQ
ncbi:MAG: molybdenum cofactor guanylyltransferase MobA [Hyphomicrobiaceae bacterium]|nr:molybdenum cofactor guanylyltransferase MobA [Hyphomicrobiaceae bacterium]